MKQRCYYERHIGYHLYGGRGIRVCERWLNSFESFLEDMGQRPSPEHSIDRKDNDGDYTPDNCVWATEEEQQRHKRTSRVLSFRGEERTLAEWSRHVGMDVRMVHARLKKGWSVERALTEPKAARFG